MFSVQCGELVCEHTHLNCSFISLPIPWSFTLLLKSSPYLFFCILFCSLSFGLKRYKGSAMNFYVSLIRFTKCLHVASFSFTILGLAVRNNFRVSSEESKRKKGGQIHFTTISIISINYLWDLPTWKSTIAEYIHSFARFTVLVGLISLLLNVVSTSVFSLLISPCSWMQVLVHCPLQSSVFIWCTENIFCSVVFGKAVSS